MDRWPTIMKIGLPFLIFYNIVIGNHLLYLFAGSTKECYGGFLRETGKFEKSSCPFFNDVTSCLTIEFEDQDDILIPSEFEHPVNDPSEFNRPRDIPRGFKGPNQNKDIPSNNHS